MDPQIFIRAAVAISPQHTFDDEAPLDTPVGYTGSRMKAIEPDYKPLLDPKSIRRMSRIIRMGTAAAIKCMAGSGLHMPDAIITGTAYGCLEDTNTFLTKLVEQKEEMLTPTAFIQSTHNAVGAQIALSLGCHGYNNTFVHRGLSFEQAMLDSLLLLKAGEAGCVLVGGIDEIIDNSHTILNRFGLYRTDIGSAQLVDAPGKGTMAGEGAGFFVLSTEKSNHDMAILEDLRMLFDADGKSDVQAWITESLMRHRLSIEDIDLFVLGKNGDKKSDKAYDALESRIADPSKIACFKHLCGEYPTASAFGLWMAAHTLKQGRVPFSQNTLSGLPASAKVVVYNAGLDGHHALMLLSAC